MRVPDANLDEVRTQGYTIVEGFLEPDLLAAAQEGIKAVFPDNATYFADPNAYADLVKHPFAGLRLFPYPNWDINRLVVNPDLVDAAERLCGTTNLDIYKIELWAKYSGKTDYDQHHHRDYGNHTIVVPKVDDDFVQMTTFLLLSDVTELNGPTKVVSLDKTKDLPLYPNNLSKGEYVDKEVSVVGPAGSLFIYRTDVLHRGSALLGENQSRFMLLVDFKPRGRPWTGKIAWPDRANRPDWAPALARMTPRERELFGFPAIGDRYWDAQTLRDVGLRYPEMDMIPYQTGVLA